MKLDPRASARPVLSTSCEVCVTQTPRSLRGQATQAAGTAGIRDGNVGVLSFNDCCGYLGMGHGAREAGYLSCRARRVTTASARASRPKTLPRLHAPVAPSQIVRVSLSINGEKRLGPMRWGFVPPTAKERKLAPINAPAETLSTSPMFRDGLPAPSGSVVGVGFCGDSCSRGPFERPFTRRVRSRLRAGVAPRVQICLASEYLFSRSVCSHALGLDGTRLFLAENLGGPLC